MDVSILFVQSRFEEVPGFVVNKAEGVRCYFFYHFLSSVQSIATDQGMRSVRPGGCFIYPPGKKQYIWGGDVRLSYDYLSFKLEDPAFLEKLGLPVNKVFYPEESQKISQKIIEMSEIFQGKGEAKDILLANQAASFFIGIAGICKENASQGTPNSEEAFQIVRKKLYKDPKAVSFKEEADKQELSLSLFSRKWRKLFGVSPREDRDEARKILKENSRNLPASELAKILGFKAINNYYRWQRKVDKSLREERNKWTFEEYVVLNCLNN